MLPTSCCSYHTAPLALLPMHAYRQLQRRTCACRSHSTTSSGRSLHELPEEVLRLIMAQLHSNDAVKLGSLHSALRSAVGTLPSLQPTLIQDVRAFRDGMLTRREQAAMQSWQKRSDSFAAFRAAHLALAIEAMKLRFAMPVVPRNDEIDASAALQWLPLRSLKLLCIEPCTSEPGLAKVRAFGLGRVAALPYALRLVLKPRQLTALCIHGP